MNRVWFYRIITVLATFAAFLYAYIVHHNRVLELQMEIPKIAKEVREIEQDNIRLRFQIQQFEDPASLMKALALKEFIHLEYTGAADIASIRVSPWPYSISISDTLVKNEPTPSAQTLGAKTLGAARPN